MEDPDWTQLAWEALGPDWTWLIPEAKLAKAASVLLAAKRIKQISRFERQLTEHGRASVEKSLRSLEGRLAQHRSDLEVYRAQGGYTSSVEREIRTFEAEIQAIKEVLGRSP